MIETFDNKIFEKTNLWIETNKYSGICSVFNTLVFLTYKDAQQALNILTQNSYRKVNQLTLNKSEWSNYRFVIDIAKENISLSADDVKNHIANTLILLKEFDFENNKFTLIFQRTETESDYFDPFE